MMRLRMEAMLFCVCGEKVAGDGDVPISAVAGDCCDTSAIYLRDGIR